MKDKEKNELIKAWLSSSNEDFQTAKGLFDLKRYSGTLFFLSFIFRKNFESIVFKEKR